MLYKTPYINRHLNPMTKHDSTAKKLANLTRLVRYDYCAFAWISG